MKTYEYGDGAMYVDLEIDDAVDRPARTQAVARALARRLPKADIILGAGSLAIDGVGAWDDLEGVVAEAMRTAERAPPRSATHEFRAVYDGPDLDDVARATGLTVHEVVALHASRTYGVELVGFLPGFAYLTSLDPRLVVARRPTPRTRVARGSLAIAGVYTGIYPLDSPGGWQIIGHVVGAELFDPARRPPALLQPGDAVRFVPRDVS